MSEPVKSPRGTGGGRKRVASKSRKRAPVAKIDSSSALSPRTKQQRAELGTLKEEDLRSAASKGDSPDDLVKFGDYLQFVKDDIEEAAEQYKLAVAKDPKHAMAQLRHAEFLWRYRGDDGKHLAATHFEKALKFALPHDSEVFNEAGWFHECARGEIPRAQELYKKAMKADPQGGTAIGNFARTLKLQKKFDEAEKYYKKALKAEPDNALLHSNTGYFYEASRDDPKKAKEMYEKAIALDGELAAALFNLARLLHLREGDGAAARPYYERAAKADPGHSNAHLGLASLAAADGDLGGAEEHYKASVAADPNNGTAIFNYAVHVDRLMNDPQHALPLYFQATVLNPTNEQISRQYLRCKERAGMDVGDIVGAEGTKGGTGDAPGDGRARTTSTTSGSGGKKGKRRSQSVSQTGLAAGVEK